MAAFCPLSLGLPLFFMALWMAIIGFAVACFVFWIWMLVDCATKQDKDSQVPWILIIIFLQALGALLYFLIPRRERLERERRAAAVPPAPPIPPARTA